MKMNSELNPRNVRFFLFLLSLLLLTISNSYAIDIFVWQKDNDITSPDPIFEENLTTFSAITRTLGELEYNFQSDTLLPENLSEYEIVIVSLGFFCNT
ncbi:MAG: hypothetical protein HN590_07575 [Calditrichaeota bacterium]|nr:hypothetical protein [Calditrichota bacterium]